MLKKLFALFMVINIEMSLAATPESQFENVISKTIIIIPNHEDLLAMATSICYIPVKKYTKQYATINQCNADNTVCVRRKVHVSTLYESFSSNCHTENSTATKGGCATGYEQFGWVPYPDKVTDTLLRCQNYHFGYEIKVPANELFLE